jgi:predicted phosphate transport protein (TIGR00153 family)
MPGHRPLRGNVMSGVIQKILPREDKYFDLFVAQADVLVSAADALATMLAGGAVAETLDQIRGLETTADDITRDVLTAVRRSFITPFDRSAITSLISSMDDAVDEIWHTAKTVRIYGVVEFEPQMRASADLAREAARLVREAIPLMRNIGRNAGRLHDITEAIVKLEGRADDLHDEGLAAIYQQHGADRPIVFFIGRELYRFVERVLDRFQDVADEIQGIVIDHG